MGAENLRRRDVIKSRVMSSGGKLSPFSLARYIATHEGPAGFYRGFMANYALLGPTILIQLPIALRFGTTVLHCSNHRSSKGAAGARQAGCMYGRAT